MRNPALLYLPMIAGLTLLAASPRLSSAQLPDAGSEPRLAVPTRATMTAPVAQQPAPPPEPQPVTAVTGGPTGVTTIGTTAEPTTATASQAATATTTRSYAASRFALTLEGASAGWLRSVEGGTATSDVVVERPGADRIAAKHLGGVRYEDLVVVTDLQSKPMTDWIAASWKGGLKRMSGTVQAADYNNTVVSEREFVNALIAGTTMPTLDAASKDAAHMTVQLASEYTRLKPGSGATAPGTDPRLQQKWLASAFRFEMNGLDGTKVSRIDSFTVRQVASSDPVGEMRDYQKEPGKLEFPNLRITLNAASAATWTAWHEDFVVNGNNGPGQERSGAIVYLDGLTKAELGRVNLMGCGIYRLAPERVDASSEAIQRVVAELYCERMELVVSK